MKCDRSMLLLYAVTDRAWTGKKTLLQQVEEALGRRRHLHPASGKGAAGGRIPAGSPGCERTLPQIPCPFPH